MAPKKADNEPLVLTEELRRALQRAEEGDALVLTLLRKLLDDNPALWQRYGDLAEQAELAWLNLACGNNLALRESLIRRLAQLRAELGGDAGSCLERLVVDRVVASWLQVHHADIHFAQLRGSTSDPARLKLATQLLDRAQQRYLVAIRSLVTARKLLRPVPSPYDVATRLEGPAESRRRPRLFQPEEGVPAGVN
jgi:hypothetical protein